VLLLWTFVVCQDDEKPVTAKKLRLVSPSKSSSELAHLRGDLSTKDALQVCTTLLLINQASNQSIKSNVCKAPLDPLTPTIAIWVLYCNSYKASCARPG